MMMQIQNVSPGVTIPFNLHYKTASASASCRPSPNIKISISKDCGTTQRSCDPSTLSTMLYYSLDPQFAAFVFSLYARHERPSNLAVFPDTLGCATHSSVSSTADILSYAHAVSLQLIALGEHYACLFTQLRTGSVIFLVGVGSIVCWKLWDYWRGGDEETPSDEDASLPPPSTPGKPLSARERAKEFIASFMQEDLVQDEDFQDEDPAFIQSKYFGPNSPVEEIRAKDDGACCSSSSDVSDGENDSDASPQHYMADNSASFTHGDMALSSEGSSLPTDEDSEPPRHPCTHTPKKRKVRRRHKASELDTRSGTLSPRAMKEKRNSNYQASLRPSATNGMSIDHSHKRDLNDLHSSESSPSHPALRLLAKKQREGSETPDSEELHQLEKLRRGSSHIVGHQGYANNNSDEEWTNNDHKPTEGESDYYKNLSRNSSLSDLLERMRYRGSARASMSRDTSVCSNLSELNSPLGFRKFPFTREDSICSNLSDLAPSECSEISLDVSLKDEIISQHTITHLADIEHELDELKSTMLEMDEEVTKFTSLPNPYTLKTTFSDNSITSGESRPNSALEILKSHKSRASFRGILASRSLSSESEPVDVVQDKDSSHHIPVTGASDGDLSLEWDSPAHGWSAVQSTPLPRVAEISLAACNSSRSSVQDDTMPSLEWDNDCLQYKEEVNNECSTSTSTSHLPAEGDVFHENEIKRKQLLPDHSSLELDLEEELSDLTLTNPTNVDLENGNIVSPQCSSDNTTSTMTTSVDSAIYSAAGSRSASASPLPQTLSQSMMSSGVATSCSDLSAATAECDNVLWSSWEKSHIGAKEFASKAKKYWSSEESGYLEGDATLDVAAGNLSPVHEIREKDTTDSCQSSPHHSIQTVIRNYPDTTPTSDNNLGFNSILEDNILNNNNINHQVMGNRPASPSVPITTNITTHNVAIGDKMDIVTYADNEWQGNTQRARTIRQGYFSIPSELGLKNIRRIRGDNYCAIRATLYQLLSQGHPLPSSQVTYSRLLNEINQNSRWLQGWSFGRRLQYSLNNVTEGFKQCLDALDALENDLANIENRDTVLISKLNLDPQLDSLLCEGVKLHMMTTALDLYKDNISGGSVPLFAMIMYARHTSLDPQQLMVHHLNPVGDTAGLEQIEMFLLGHTMKATLQVVRPSCYSQDDFLCYYPDSNIGTWPAVTLIAEDDRHYNVLVK